MGGRSRVPGHHLARLADRLVSGQRPVAEFDPWGDRCRIDAAATSDSTLEPPTGASLWAAMWSGAEETANNHAADLQLAGQFGVDFFSYWHDSTRGVVICFAQAPGKEAMTQAHRASHGNVPGEIIEVSESDVVRFLGKVHDPVDASEVTSAFRTICFTDLVGSTELLDRIGQSEYMVLLAEHDLIIRRASSNQEVGR